MISPNSGLFCSAEGRGEQKEVRTHCRAGWFLLLLQHLWGMMIQGDICLSCCLKMNINYQWSLYSSELWPSNCLVQVTQPCKVPQDVNMYFICRNMDACRSALPVQVQKLTSALSTWMCNQPTKVWQLADALCWCFWNLNFFLST